MNMSGRIIFSLLTLIAIPSLASRGSAGFHVITTARGTGADAYIDGGSANTNFGTSDTLLQKGQSGIRKVYVRFDISGIPKPLKFASLELTVLTAATRMLSVYGLNDGTTDGEGRLGEDWSETAITWNNAPAHATSLDPVQGAGTENGGESQLLRQAEFEIAINPSGTGKVVLSGDTLLDFLNADTDGRVTFILTTPGTVIISWKSKEHADDQPPRLLLGDATSEIVTLNPVADAYVDDFATTSLKGTEDQVIVRSNNGLLKGYLRFDLTGVKRPILSATLFVEQSATTSWDTLSLYGLNDGTTEGTGRLGEFWEDGVITAGNAPANLVGENAFAVGSGTANGGETRKLWTTHINELSSLARIHLLSGEQTLVDFLNEDTNNSVTIAMHATTTTGTRSVRFASRENTTYSPPRLVLVTTPPPGALLITIR